MGFKPLDWLYEASYKSECHLMMTRSVEKAALALPGVLVFLAMLALLGTVALLAWSLGGSPLNALFGSIIGAIPVWLIFMFFILPGFIVIQPNDAKVLTFLGNYSGTVKQAGWYYVNPWANKKRISLRIRNFTSQTLKVNDAMGNPIEIGAVIVWQVVDTARALFDVDDYEGFVGIQAETAIRALASHYPYDDAEGISLRGQQDDIAAILKQELQQHLALAGLDIVDARLSHLAYAPEIAQSMLRRQQAHAVIAARQTIVEGAVGMVRQALAHLEDVVPLDNDRKAAMVNNLLVALVSESQAHPVINTGQS
jgi:regulator of protease activity HflC (stomatin/prohibitin superfamily)